MRASALFCSITLLAAYAALGCEALDTGGGGADAGSAADGGASPVGDAGVLGAGCGIEVSSGAELCVATSICPSVVVDTQAMPSCGFRIRGGIAELVCACSGALCPMGTFTTCAEAANLLATQTELGVCMQVAEGRCSEAAAPPAQGGGNPACDRACLADCGGGAACAAVCNCD